MWDVNTTELFTAWILLVWNEMGNIQVMNGIWSVLIPDCTHYLTNDNIQFIEWKGDKRNSKIIINTRASIGVLKCQAGSIIAGRPISVLLLHEDKFKNTNNLED